MRIERIPQINENQDKEVDISLATPVINKYKNKKGAMIPLLQDIQQLYSFLPKKVMFEVSKELNYSISEIYAVATFYAQFKLKPSGKFSIKVCKGTACHVQNATAIINSLTDHLGVPEGETTTDGIFTLEAVSCLGCCSLAPAMMIGDETFGKLTGDSAVKIVKNYDRN